MHFFGYEIWIIESALKIIVEKKVVYILLSVQFLPNCCNLEKVTEWGITNTEAGNEMVTLIISTKYNSHQRREVDKPLVVVDYIDNILPHLQ